MEVPREALDAVRRDIEEALRHLDRQVRPEDEEARRLLRRALERLPR
ncbi:MAG TPA: hypothetical protein VEJ84_19440 [Acidimicrobiales bacterium]|nr:hypothetical protein [Acidimicrobiales bacterium]